MFWAGPKFYGQINHKSSAEQLQWPSCLFSESWPKSRKNTLNKCEKRQACLHSYELCLRAQMIIQSALPFELLNTKEPFTTSCNRCLETRIHRNIKSSMEETKHWLYNMRLEVHLHPVTVVVIYLNVSTYALMNETWGNKQTQPDQSRRSFCIGICLLTARMKVAVNFGLEGLTCALHTLVNSLMKHSFHLHNLQLSSALN